MSNKMTYHDLYAFHPGYYIADLIEDMEITQEEFSTRMGTTPKTVSRLVNGKCNLSNDLAKKISAMTGSSVDVWLNLQKAYDEKVIEIEAQRSRDEQIRVVQMIDYSYFVKVAKLPPTRKSDEKIDNLRKYFVISDLRILCKPDFLANFRTGISEIQEKNIVNSQAWLQTAMNFAKLAIVSKFDADRLECSLPEIRAMTIQKPDVFLPRLREIFSDCGIAFVLLPHLKNSGINGAVKWYGSNQVILAMNDRRCYADTFWFSLFHEIGHIFQQKPKKVFISGESISDADETLEREADAFAQNYLIG